VTRSRTGGDANGNSYYAAISGNGAWVAFSSDASNLTRHDDHNGSDVFLWHKQDGAILRVTRGGLNGDMSHTSYRPSISNSGRFVAFDSTATNLVRDDGNGQRDVFYYDRRYGTIHRVSHSETGGDADGPSQSPDISGNGRWVIFKSAASNLISTDTLGHTDIFLWDKTNGSITRVDTHVGSSSQSADGDSTAPKLENGSASFTSLGFVFQSSADDLIYGDTNGSPDVFFEF